MEKMSLFIPLVKVDLEQRIVEGYAAEERVDKRGEIMDYAASKPRFQAWSKAIQEASGGLSLGNVRAMHGKVAAGKLTALEFLDDEKRIWVRARVVDDAEWAKCVEGVYTGFSVGGDYGKRWPDGESRLMRYEALPIEMSLVDNPCMYGAVFTVVKADGQTETREFAKVAEREDVSKTVDRESPLSAKDEGANDLQKGGEILDKAITFGTKLAEQQVRKESWQYLDVLGDVFCEVLCSDDMDVAQKKAQLMLSVQEFADKMVEVLGAMDAEGMEMMSKALMEKAHQVDVVGVADNGVVDNGAPVSEGDDLGKSVDSAQADEAGEPEKADDSAPADEHGGLEKAISQMAEIGGRLDEMAGGMRADMQKVAGDVDGLKKNFDQMMRDLASVVDAVERMNERLEKVEAQPVDGGPMARAMGVSVDGAARPADVFSQIKAAQASGVGISPRW